MSHLRVAGPRTVGSVAATAAGIARARGRGLRTMLIDPLLPTLVCGAGGDDRLALTYDDGPTPGLTARIGETLAAHGHRATFFVLSDRAARSPEVLDGLRAAGHEIALHGGPHRPLTELDARSARAQVRAARGQLSALGHDSRWFRPPKGAQSRLSYLAARSAGVRVVGWTADVQDYVDDGEVPLGERLERALRPGAIVLLHDGEGDDAHDLPAAEQERRLALLDLTVAALRTRGLRSVTVSELAAAGAIHRCWLQ